MAPLLIRLNLFLIAHRHSNYPYLELKMYLCYIDESGTSSIPGNTSHFILAGLSVPIWHWTDCEREISQIKTKYSLKDSEIHTAWILRKYLEQSKISGFGNLSYQRRKSAVDQYRNRELLRLQRSGNKRHYRQTRKNYLKTNAYVHLTYNERKSFILEVAKCISNWGFARLFAECIDKIYYDPARNPESVDEQSFSQIVSRFEQYLENISTQENKYYGLLIHDNNQTIAANVKSGFDNAPGCRSSAHIFLIFGTPYPVFHKESDGIVVVGLGDGFLEPDFPLPDMRLPMASIFFSILALWWWLRRFLAK
jgi:hypothetical protein